MVEFETQEKREHEFGTDNFLEVSRKIARDEDSETEFLAITRGYRDREGSRRYKTNLTMPYDAKIVDFAATSLMDVTEFDLPKIRERYR